MWLWGVSGLLRQLCSVHRPTMIAKGFRRLRLLVVVLSVVILALVLMMVVLLLLLLIRGLVLLVPGGGEGGRGDTHTLNNRRSTACVVAFAIGR